MSAWLSQLSRRIRRFEDDQQGALLAIYAFVALGLAVSLWMVIDSGSRVAQKEVTQTAADAAAYSTAAIKAKGMNLIAFINLMMAMTLAVLMMLRALKVAVAGIAAAAALACFQVPADGTLCSAKGTLDKIEKKLSDLQHAKEPELVAQIRTLAKLERAFNRVAGLVAWGEGYSLAAKSAQNLRPGSPAAAVILPLPLSDRTRELPAKDGTWIDLCNEQARIQYPIDNLGLAKLPSVNHKVDTMIDDTTHALKYPLQTVICGLLPKAEGGYAPVYHTNPSGNPELQSAQQFSDWDSCAAASLEYDVSITTKLSGGGSFTCPGFLPSYRDSSALFGASLTCDGKDHKSWHFQSCLVVHRNPDTPLLQEPGQGFKPCWQANFCPANIPAGVSCTHDDQDWSNFEQSVTLGYHPAFCNVDTLPPLPVPLVLADDWRQRRYSTALLGLLESGAAGRLRNAGLVSKEATANADILAPRAEIVVGSSRAAFGVPEDDPLHEDLWHMAWRGHLVQLDPNALNVDPEGVAASFTASSADNPLPSESLQATQAAQNLVQSGALDKLRAAIKLQLGATTDPATIGEILLH